ncbi:MAG: hypothetical protein IIU08_02485 [Clostridia bacterium]|nr:hypothetical protein [Clostridia bacterium]
MESTSRGILKKTGLFLAVILTAAAAVGCVLTAWYFILEDVYRMPKDVMIGERNYRKMFDDSREIVRSLNRENQTVNHRKLSLFSESVTNLRYAVTDENGTVLLTNLSDAETAVGEEGWTEILWYGISTIDPKTGEEHFINYQTDIPAKTGSIVEQDPSEPRYSTAEYLFRGRLEKGLPVRDEYRLNQLIFGTAYDFRYAVYPVGAVSLLLCVLCFILLMCASARRPGEDGLFPGLLHKVPFDLILAAGVGLWLLVTFFLVKFIGMMDSVYFQLIAIAVMGIFSAVVFLGLSMSAAARIKDGSILRNTVIFRLGVLLWTILCFVCRAVGQGFRAAGALIRGIPLIWKTLLALVLIAGADFAAFAIFFPYSEGPFVVHVLMWLVLVPLILWFALSMRKLEKGGEALAAGNLTKRVSTAYMPPSLKKHGENLNAAAEGLNRAVEERMKSERMKTELITNVSHDLKTPLTSVVNYAGLIAGEETDNPKIAEYCEVLLRQSERLKRLIDDLVEASKAQTGTLEVELAPTDISVFLEQAAGEYGTRLAEASLPLVLSIPDHPVTIRADGRRLWRVFDNLMNNIVKYAQPGTRVYLTLEEVNSFAVVTFKNVSREPLNLTPDELMERFVRGDASRNSATDGNGLGLSIAKSLTELQGGALTLSIDGDLFKAVLHFPKVPDAALPNPAPHAFYPADSVPTLRVQTLRERWKDTEEKE